MDKQSLLELAIKLADQSEQYTRERFAQIQESENLYLNEVAQPLPGLYNVPVPVMGGFIDSLVSRISGKTVVNFNKQNNSDAVKAKKISAMWRKESSAQYENWHAKDILAKKEAAFSGRAIYKIWSESEPKYKHHLEIIHYKDFLCDPLGGYYLENHSFTGQKNIFKTKAKIKYGIKRGYYEKDALDCFKKEKKVEDKYQNQNNELKLLGLESNLTYETPDNVANLFELYITTDEGRYYVLFHKDSKTLVRAAKLKELKKNELYPYKSWATHPNLKIFWSKAPADDIKAVARQINTLVNQGINNIQKRNFPQRAFDAKIFNDPRKLIYNADGLIPVNSYGQNIGNAVYEFQTPDNTQIIINLINFLDGIAGLKTGVTADVQGQSAQKAVGIYYGNMEQIANRFGPTSIFYSDCWIELGAEYLEGLKENLTEKQMIKLIGVDGIKWDEIRKEDLKTKEDLEINISATNQEAQIKESEVKAKTQALALITNNPSYAQRISPDFVITEVLKMGGYDEDDIMRALDVSNTASEEQLNKAAEVIEEFIEGRKPKMNFQADTGFIQKLIDFTLEQDIDEKLTATITAYALSHMEIVSRNTARKALANPMPIQNGISTNNVPGITNLNIPNAEPGNVQERSQALTNQNTI